LSQNVVPLARTVSLKLFSHVHEQHFKEYAGYVEYGKSLSCLLKSWSACSRDSRPYQRKTDTKSLIQFAPSNCVAVSVLSIGALFT
jgi:hypothetical protein